MKCRVNTDPNCLIPYTMEINHIIANTIPKLVLGKLIRNWLFNTIQKEINSAQIEEIVAHLYKPIGNGVASQSICISKMYTVRHVRLGLQVICHNTNSSSISSSDSSSHSNTIADQNSISSIGNNTTCANKKINNSGSTTTSTTYSSATTSSCTFLPSNSQLRTGFDQKQPKTRSNPRQTAVVVRGTGRRSPDPTAVNGGSYRVVQYNNPVSSGHYQQQQQYQQQKVQVGQQLILHTNSSASSSKNNSSRYSNDTTSTTAVDDINIVVKNIKIK